VGYRENELEEIGKRALNILMRRTGTASWNMPRYTAGRISVSPFKNGMEIRP
jgi:hypothetical protein